MTNNLFLGNGCGYNTTTKDYPYLYWPAPDVSALESGVTVNSALQAFKYSMCVKSCPKNVSSVAVQCKMPTKYFIDSGKFANCQYYPYAYDGYLGEPFRYDTALCMNNN